MIQARQLGKNFRIYQKQPGFWGSLVSLVHRKWQDKPAVENFDLSIPPGEIIGLLGPNGAGKTTLMKMFTGIIVPSAGDLKVLGFEPHRRDRRFLKQIALVMGQKSQLWWDLPAMDSFDLLGRYYELEPKAFQQRVGELSELMGVSKLLHIHVRKLSLGERMKLELMASLLHQPRLILLDEPTIGLDLIAQNNIRQFLKRYHQESQTTLVVTSHYMADIEALCRRIVLIIEGKKQFDGSKEDFAGLLGSQKLLTLRFDQPQDPQDPYLARFAPTWSQANTQVELNLPEGELREAAIRLLESYPVVDFATEKMPIERVLQHLMENSAIKSYPPSGQSQ